MTDIYTDRRGLPARTDEQEHAPEPLDGVTRDQLISIIELFYFAYRDFTGEADALLAEFGLGRAHHRVLHFVNRHPGLRVADLLDILKITKQSLARVLKQLVDRGYVLQQEGPQDRRERLLHLTRKGRELADKLVELQSARITAALAAAGDGAAPVSCRFLASMIGSEERSRIEALIFGPRLSDR